MTPLGSHVGRRVDRRSESCDHRMERSWHLGADWLDPFSADQANRNDHCVRHQCQLSYTGSTAVQQAIARARPFGIDAEHVAVFERRRGGVCGANSPAASAAGSCKPTRQRGTWRGLPRLTHGLRRAPAAVARRGQSRRHPGRTPWRTDLVSAWAAVQSARCSSILNFNVGYGATMR